jgi:hypothetical protein
MHPTHKRKTQLVRRLALPGLCVLVVLGLVGCDEREIKKYSAAIDKTTTDYTRLGSYRVPDGWSRLAKPKQPSKDPSLDPLATFEVRSGEKTASITITRFPGKAGGVNFNIVRWRGQVGFPKAKSDSELEKEMRQVEKEMRELTVDGKSTPYVDISNPDKTDTGRILGVIAERGPVTWFFKMNGPPDLVGQQKAAFEAFVQSVRFGGTGGKDG